MKEMELVLKPIGQNGLFGLRNQINEFVHSNFELLYEGATRLGLNIPKNYYAPRRVQIGGTRLHETIGLKYAEGHKYSEETSPSEKQLRQTIKDLQSLINSAAENIPAPFELKIC